MRKQNVTRNLIEHEITFKCFNNDELETHMCTYYAESLCTELTAIKYAKEFTKNNMSTDVVFCKVTKIVTRKIRATMTLDQFIKSSSLTYTDDENNTAETSTETTNNESEE